MGCPYTGLVFNSRYQLHVDHMVPLKEAWDSGAHAWSAQRLKDFANDLDLPAALIAVKVGANTSKGARDPAEWMPPKRTYWCSYLKDWVSVKRKWDLTIDQAEADSMRLGFKVCGKYKSGDALGGRH